MSTEFAQLLNKLMGDLTRVHPWLVDDVTVMYVM